MLLKLEFILFFVLFHYIYKYCFSYLPSNLSRGYKSIFMLIFPFITSCILLVVSMDMFSLLTNLSLFILLTIGSISDIKTKIISNKLILVFSTIIILLNFFFKKNLYILFINSIIPFIFMYIIYLISKNKLGGGDVKVFIPISMVIGYYQSFNALFLGAFIALIFLLIFKFKELSGYDLAFIPFITIGVFLSYFIKLF